MTSGPASTPGGAPTWQRSLPALLIGGYVVLLPVQFEVASVLRVAPSDLFLALYVLLRGPRLRHVPRAWSSWLLALPALLGLGMVVALVKTETITRYAILQKGIGMLVLLTAFVCLVDFLRSWERLYWLLRLFVLTVAFHSVVAVAAFVVVAAGGPDIPLINEPFPGVRLSGLLLDANAWGGVIAVALLLHTVTAANRKPLVTGWPGWVATVTLPAALLLTFSRSAWLCLVGGLLVAVAFRPVPGGRAVLRLAVPGLLLAPLVASLLPLLIPGVDRLITRESQVTARLVSGGAAVDEFLSNPLLGMGLGAYEVEYGLIVHNTTLWFLTEFGLVGLVVFAGLVFGYGGRLLAAERSQRSAHGAVLVALLAAHGGMLGLSLGIEALYQRSWWLILASAGAAYALARAAAAGRGADGTVPAGAGAR